MWIFLTIIAATLQAFRNLEQKNLNKKLDLLTVSWSRFILPFPFTIIFAFLTFDQINQQFFLFCTITAVMQVAANMFLLQTVKSKNFTVGVLFYKTEVLQVALLGALFFNQEISTIAYIAIAIAAFGMFLMSDINLKKQKFDKSVLFGLASGFCFAISSLHIKLASEEMIQNGSGDFFSAISVLMWVILLQNIFIILIKTHQKSAVSDLKNLFKSENRRSFFVTSILSFLGSVCWFTAFTIGTVAYVKAVGQFELIVAAFISHFYLKERHSTREVTGIMITSLAILVIIIFH